MDAATRISDLIVLSQRLIDLLSRENHALQEHRSDEVRTLLEQKDELSRAYETRIKGLVEHADGAAIGAVDQTLRDQLRTLGEAVQRLSQENAERLRIAIEVNRRVLQEVADAVKAGQQRLRTYSATGAPAFAARRAAPTSVPISLDKSL